MKRWRGEPDHDHWQKVPPAKWVRPAAFAGLGLVSASMAVATAHAGQTGCESGGRLLCSLVRLVAEASKASMLSVEVGAWSLMALALCGVAWLQWTRRAR